MSCEIIQFSAIAGLSKKDRKKIARAAILSRPSRVEQAQPDRDEGEPITLRNKHLRDARRDAWCEADAATRSWSARLDFQAAVSWAQRMGVPEGRGHPADPEDRHRQPNVDRWREAVVKQLLTPAPDVAAVAWKRAKLSGRDFPYLPVKPDRVERVIADDEAFLTSHPTRTKGLRKMAGELDPPNEGGEANA